LQYSLLGAPFSDPFVGDGSDPTTNPFDCGANDGFYCYPGGIVSSDPYLWDDFVASLSESPTPGDTAAEIRRLLGDWWSWVWTHFGVNGPPLAQSDDYTAPPAAQSRAFALMVGPENVLANDIEPESDPIVAVLASPPRHGEVTLNPDGTFAYTPNPGFVGFDWFRYTAYDFATTSNSATVWVSASGLAGLIGDYNGDGAVDTGDGDFWRSNYGEAGGPADGNGDGFVDAADYTIWRDGMSQAAAQTQANVQSPPDPPALPPRIDVSPAAFPTPDVASRTRPATRARFVELRVDPATSQRALPLAAGTAVAARDESLATWSRDERNVVDRAADDAYEPLTSSLWPRRIAR
jgi:hypothetical protein